MQEQLQEILRRENLTSSQFADKIGVQRSSVSHVISGRNKPGFDFIQKILLAFPGLNAKWLITGSGGMYGRSLPSDTPLEIELTDSADPSVLPSESEPEPEPRKAEPRDLIKEETPNVAPGEIDRIVVFYKDRTFREYKQES